MRPVDNDRECARGPFPEHEVRGLTDAELDHAIDAWYANQYADESCCHVYE